jgi:lipoprotein-anchoring transpeptidase ErfK/SrfK
VRLRALLLLAAVACSAACGATSRAPRHVAQRHPGAAKRACSRRYERLGSRRLALAAVVRRRAVARRTPGGAALASFGRLNQNGVPTVLGVLGVRKARACGPLWYRVQLPLRPNGVTGWVRSRDVAIGAVTTRIDVDLSAKRLTLYRNGRRVLSATAAVGAPATPTPTGRFYVNQRLVPTDPSGPYGPGAVGISAFSDVLTGWAQGGPIAIHGTNEPWSIGRAVSNGCIRLPNATLRRVFAAALAGTPVVIHP